MKLFVDPTVYQLFSKIDEKLVGLLSRSFRNSMKNNSILMKFYRNIGQYILITRIKNNFQKKTKNADVSIFSVKFWSTFYLELLSETITLYKV